jgi:hypothetical protein
LVKPSDLVTDELVQTCIEPNSLPIKHEGFRHVKLELVNNQLTLGSIKGTNVHVHHYHNVLVKDNDVAGNMIEPRCLERHLLMFTFLEF